MKYLTKEKKEYYEKQREQMAAGRAAFIKHYDSMTQEERLAYADKLQEEIDLKFGKPKCQEVVEKEIVPPEVIEQLAAYKEALLAGARKRALERQAAEDRKLHEARSRAIKSGIVNKGGKPTKPTKYYRTPQGIVAGQAEFLRVTGISKKTMYKYLEQYSNEYWICDASGTRVQ
jgi:hypothetical protein